MLLLADILVCFFFSVLAVLLHAAVYIVGDEVIGESTTATDVALDRLMCTAWVGCFMIFNLTYWASARVAVARRKEELIVEAVDAGFTMKIIEKGSLEAATPKEVRHRKRRQHKMRRSKSK